MKVTVYQLVCICFFLTVLSCDNQFVGEEEKMKQENIEALTKSVPVVCVDLFVSWDGKEMYLGTACNVGGSSGGGGTGSITSGYKPDDIIESPPYTPNEVPNFPNTSGGSGGGTSHYNPLTGKREYVYGNLQYIYDIGSTLDLVQKDKLDKLIGYFLSTTKNKELFDYMVAKKVKVKFHCDPNSKKIAYYDYKTKSIVIKNLNDLKIYQLQEELVHSAQHQCFYGDKMPSYYKNCEFEAKVYFDLFSGINGIYDNYIAIETDNRPEFIKIYKDWINDMVDRKHGSFTDTSGFNDLCKMWIGYSGAYSSSFEPSLLLRFYRKPIPPTPPTN